MCIGSTNKFSAASFSPEDTEVGLQCTQRLNLPWWRHQIENFSVLLAFCAGTSLHRRIHRTEASVVELRCFLWSAPEPTLEQTVETLVIWDATALIMTSFWWKYWNNVDFAKVHMVFTGSINDNDQEDYDNDDKMLMLMLKKQWYWWY